MTRSIPALLSAALIALGAAACGGGSPAPAPDEAPEADVAVSAEGEDDGWGLRDDPVAQRVEPFQIFDNLYYVGIDWLSSYLLVTTDGLILIGSLYGDFIDNVIDGIRAVGFDPSDLKYVLVTHGHFDHVGGAARFQET